MARKVLMVGLGGTGCNVAARVRERIIREHRENDNMFFSDIAFVGFDTDERKDDKGTLPLVKTSRNVTVGDLLSEHPERRSWFPDEDPFLYDKTMTRGAGQIRILSRLALEDTFERIHTTDRPLKALDDAIDMLQMRDGDGGQISLVIMIISSFAGGTGSGIFIQMALQLRKTIREKFGSAVADATLIRGLFALPDIYVGAQGGPTKIESVYANAYASLKELCALNRLFSGDSRISHGIQMDYGPLFDSRRFVRMNERMPYNYIFFIDNVNEHGFKLSGIKAYERMIADIAYMQVYSPMANDMESTEDNLIREQIYKKGQNIFGSCGFCRIIYPHDAIVEYCVKHIMSDNLSASWMYFDEIYRALSLDAKDRRRKDPSYPMPVRSEIFTASVSNAMKNGSQFTSLKDEICLPPDENNPAADPGERQDVYLSVVKEYIKQFVNGPDATNAAVKAAADAANIDNFGKSREDIVRHINISEKALRDYSRTVEKQVSNIWRSVLMDIIPTRDSVARERHSLFSLLHSVNKPEFAVHPIAARYMLYKLSEALGTEVSALTESVSTGKESINGHLEADWDDNKQGRQTAAQVIPRFTGKKRKLSQYKDARDQCYDTVTQYAIDRLSLEVLGGLKIRVDKMIKWFENMFDSLKDVAKEYDKAVKELELKHSIDTDTEIFILADKKSKQKAYSAISIRNPDLGAELNNTILSLVQNAVDKEEAKESESAGLGLSKEELEAEESKRVKTLSKEVKKLFREDIARQFYKIVEADTSDDVNINVVQALDKVVEAQTDDGLYQGTKEAREELLQKVRNNALPMLIYKADKKTTNTDTFWGVNRETVESLSESELSKYFGGEAPVVDEGYSPYEICCYRAVYNLNLTDIPKFCDTGSNPGIYFRNYESLREKMTENGDTEDAMTPHTDKRWISREYLPMISTERNNQDDQDAAYALILGVMYGCVVKLKDDRLGKWYMHAAYESDGVEKIQLLKIENNPVRSGDYPNAYRALRNDPVLTARLIAYLTELLEDDSTVREKSLTTAVKNNDLLKAMCEGAPNLLALFACLMNDVDLAAEERSTGAFKKAVECLMGKISFSYGPTLKQFKDRAFGNAGLKASLCQNHRWLRDWGTPAETPEEEAEENAEEQDAPAEKDPE